MDTSTIVAHWRSPLPELIANEGELFLPLIALGELHAGARRARDRSKIERQIAMLLGAAVVMVPTESTAALYGTIHAELARAGTPIPQNDIWIAAMAREHELPLVTCDAHFQQVQGLIILTW
jgi:tRNA(fMet)-specific endonuclease VapC